MSDFMKSIVQEVMKPNQKPKENPLFGSETRFLYSKSTVENKSPQTIPKINRPNYQQKNRQKNLSFIKEELADHRAESRSNNESVVKKESLPPVNGYDKDPLTRLQTLSLVQGNQPIHQQWHHSPMRKNNVEEESQLIGQTRDGMKAWIYSSPHPKLLQNFQRSIKSNAIGVITSQKCQPAQLFILNELLREYPSMKYFLLWDKESTQSFVLELYEDNAELLKQGLKVMFQRLSQSSYKQIQVYQAHSPSPWLTKQLDLKTQVEGVAVLEGIEYYTAVFLLDRLLKRSADKNIHYQIETNYLLMYGNYETVKEVSGELLKQAERLS
ncbi:hypothetical protein [Cytobacillus solani]|uniref:Uncharacterized protein n=1 Tax=Cytobacillus solani TaxID=1637975 RepID=A0A0Q3SII7_9BACI|nr:hypothetical protein [Cytobacillus solani]KQL19420.1 hypothetical protein AN957_13165 [Cytobacillus solani]